MLIEQTKATDLIRTEMKRVHRLYGCSYTYVVLMALLDRIEKIEGEPDRLESDEDDPLYYDLLIRRKELFERLGSTISDKTNRGKLILYIFELWKYIADVHGEEFCIEVDKDVLDGEDGSE